MISDHEAIWSASNGLLKIGWADLSPIYFNENEVLLHIQFKAKDLTSMNSSIMLELYEYCEIADADATAYENIILSVPVMETLTTSLNTMHENGFSCMNVPNPFTKNTEIIFTLQEDAQVVLTVLDTRGETIARLINDKLKAGVHKIPFNGSKLVPGIYFYSIEIKGDKEFSVLEKMIISR